MRCQCNEKVKFVKEDLLVNPDQGKKANADTDQRNHQTNMSQAIQTICHMNTKIMLIFV